MQPMSSGVSGRGRIWHAARALASEKSVFSNLWRKNQVHYYGGQQTSGHVFFQTPKRAHFEIGQEKSGTHIYIYIYICVCVCVYIYIFIYIIPYFLKDIQRKYEKFWKCWASQPPKCGICPNGQVGDRVAVPFILSCGNCRQCARNRPTICEVGHWQTDSFPFDLSKAIAWCIICCFVAHTVWLTVALVLEWFQT